MTGRVEGRGRTRDAQRARQVILDSAEAHFAQYGFDGARINNVAKASGYNVSLLCQYFGDKGGLYAAVLKRAQDETNKLQEQVLGPVLLGETLIAGPEQFRVVLGSMVRTVFDYLLAHPHLLRILTWEMASGWQTYRQIASQIDSDETVVDQLDAVFETARSAGWLRSDWPTTIQLTMIFQLCQSYLAFLPFYQLMPGGAEVSSADALRGARNYLTEFVTAAMMFDLPTATTDGEAT